MSSAAQWALADAAGAGAVAVVDRCHCSGSGLIQFKAPKTPPENG